MTNRSKSRLPFSPEVRERAISMVREHRSDHSSEWATVVTCPVSSDHAWFETTTPVAVFDCPLRNGDATVRSAEAPYIAAIGPVAVARHRSDPG